MWKMQISSTLTIFPNPGQLIKLRRSPINFASQTRHSKKIQDGQYHIAPLVAQPVEGISGLQHPFSQVTKKFNLHFKRINVS